MRHSTVCRQASMKLAKARIAPLPKPKSRGKDELAFLPAALEIVETPVPPLAGAIGGTIIALFCLALAWASFGHIDIVASASGKIIPTGRTKVIQPFETGVVRAIRGRDGPSGEGGGGRGGRGATMSEAELGHLKSDLIAAQLETARLRAALAGHDDPLVDFQPPESASPKSIEMHRRLLVSQVAEQTAKIQAIK